MILEHGDSDIFMVLSRGAVAEMPEILPIMQVSAELAERYPESPLKEQPACCTTVTFYVEENEINLSRCSMFEYSLTGF